MKGRFTALLSAALLAPAAAHAQTPTTLNLSHDLVSNGIASSNMTPNTPTLDSRPLFNAGVAYAQKHNIPTVTADRGSYYFLTQDNAAPYISMSVSNLTIDLQYSDLYFLNGNQIGLSCNACSGVTLQNFTMDYINLPFTQVQVTGVNAATRTISYQTIPGWPSPTTLNAWAVPDESDFFLFVFRNGQQLSGTGRLTAASPIGANTLQDTGGEPWEQSSFATMQAGDIVVVTFRYGGGMLSFFNGSNNTLRNISIYSSAQLGFGATAISNTTLDHLQVIPRPGTDRLISTNADAIRISLSGASNTMSNSTVQRACAEAFRIDGEWYALVNGPPTGTSVEVTLISPVNLPVGMSFDFISIDDGTVIGTATTTAVSPAVAQQTGAPGEVITLTLDQTIAGLAANYGVIPSDPSLRGGGSVISGNLVQQEVYGRGIFLGGVENVTVTDNVTDTTNDVGVLVGEQNDNPVVGSDLTGPSTGLIIHNNVVNNAMEYGVTSAYTIDGAAAINTYVTDGKNNYVTATPTSNFSITGNLITNTIRSGIRVESLSGGTITGNTIINASQDTVDYMWCCLGSGETQAQYEADFSMPIVIANSTGVTSSGNITSGTTFRIGSSADGSLRLAPGSIAAAYGTNLAGSTALLGPGLTPPVTLGGASVKVTDNTGTARFAGLFYASPTQVNFQVPPDTAPGVATITIGGAVYGALIGTVGPSLYSTNQAGTGVAAATAVLTAMDGTQTAEPVFTCTSSGCTATPLSLGSATDTLSVTFYGTGIQGRSSLVNVVAEANGIPLPVTYAGPSSTPGLDQVVVTIPSTLAGAGSIPVILMVDGYNANAVNISIQ
jgi:uncharacterized protein (TIGR03437 family)